MDLMESKPLVSVIIPVYNCERFLTQAIDSVLAQTYGPLEIIVVDDGSTDGSANVAAQYASSVSYCHQSHTGVSSARNQGVKRAQGSFFSFLDADDLWLEDKIALQMAAFDQDRTLEMVFGHAIQFRHSETGGEAGLVVDHPSVAEPGRVPGTLIIRRPSFFQVGLFSTEWQVGEWADWYLRATEQNIKSLMLPQVVMKRRIHGGNIGIRKRDSQVQYVRVLKVALDRRRKNCKDGSSV